MKKVLFFLVSAIVFFSCKGKPKEVHFERDLSSVAELLEQSKEFDKAEVIEVVEGIHVAIGFGLANSILIEGDKGNIIVDCMESGETAAEVKKAFNAISDKPIKAIIYTHNHADHIFGAAVLAGDDHPEVYAHELTNYYIDRLLSVVRDGVGRRSYRMFGVHLGGDSHINCGIGPSLDSNPESSRSLLRPTKTFKDELEIEIEGVKIKLAHVPGETDDQLCVWLPKRKVLLAGDNIYKSFPNLYTIRGTPYRDVKQWAKSLDKMRALGAEYVIPSHTRPIVGAENVEQVLRDYADGIRFVHDQTIRLLNKGLTPNEIAEQVVLPPHLSQSPYLKEFYGRVDWSVKNIFSGYIGWFDGNASTLLPLALKEQAEEMANLVGGASALLAKAETALEDEKYQWTLELTDYLFLLLPTESKVKDLRYEALVALGEQQSNPNARNYLLSQALEIRGQNMEVMTKNTPDFLHQFPIEAIFNSMAVKLIPSKSIDYDKKLLFHFTDTNEYWTLHVRRGVLEVMPYRVEGVELEVKTTSKIWKEIVGKLRSSLAAIAKGDLKVEGGLGAFRTFMGMFQEE